MVILDTKFYCQITCYNMQLYSYLLVYDYFQRFMLNMYKKLNNKIKTSKFMTQIKVSKPHSADHKWSFTIFSC